MTAESTKRTDAVQIAWESALALFKPPPRLTVSMLADERRYLSPESSAKPGKYRVSFAPYQAEPMDAANDPTVSMVVLMFASQLGKTEVMNNIVQFFIEGEPSPILMVQPTIEMAESWSKERLAPMVRDCPTLAALVGGPRSRDSNNKILFKSFPGGNIAIGGANAPAGLASRPRRVVLLDEVDRFPISAGTEGDPCSIAIRRTESFHNPVVVMSSTPTIKDRSRIEAEYLTTDRRKWNVTCPACKHDRWVFAWTDVQWTEKTGADAVIVCPQCGARHNDKARRDMVRTGRWVADEPGNPKRGYRLSGINSCFAHKRAYKSRLHQMVAEYLDYKSKGPESEKTWINTFLAETYEEAGESLDPNALMDRREDYTMPPQVVLLTAGADVQGDRIECEIVGWGEGEESWGIEYHVIQGNTARREVWQAFDDLLNKTWTHPCGATMRIHSAFIDSGHKNTMVYDFVKPRQVRRIYAIKGSPQHAAPLVSRPKKSGVTRVNLFQIGTDTAKESIYSRTQLTSGYGMMHFPKHYDEEWFKQLTAEKKVVRYRNGQPYATFECPTKSTRNEALDCRVYAYACMSMARPNWKRLAAMYRIKDAPEPEPEEVAPLKIVRPPQNRSKRRGSGFVGGW